MLAERNQWTRFPRPRAKYYTNSVVGHRPKVVWYMVYWYIEYMVDGRTENDLWYMVYSVRYKKQKPLLRSHPLDARRVGGFK